MDRKPSYNQSNRNTNSSTKSISVHDSRFSNMSRDPTFACDRKLLPRIRQYLADNSDNVFITADSIVEVFLLKYPEYKRKKKNTFTKAVSEALQYTRQQNTNSASQNKPPKRKRTKEKKNQKIETKSELSTEFSDSDSFSDYDVDEFEPHNVVNKSLRDLYSQSPRQHNMKDNVVGEFTPDGTVLKNPNQKFINMEMNREQNDNSEAIQPLSTQTVIKTANKKIKQNQPSKEKIETESSKYNQLPVKTSSDVKVQYSLTKFKDIGGCEKTLAEVTKLLVHMKHPAIYQKLKLKPPRGFLLHGPPGCGKTLLANAIAGELGLPFIKMAATELISGVSGESEERIRDVFFKAVAIAPCILFLDEIDSITPKREVAQREMERRIVAQLLACMDELNDKDINTQVMVIGATNRPDSLDPALRRAGRFDREISMGIPDETARARVLKVLCGDLELGPNVNFDELAKMTPGFVGADLMALATEAGMCAVERAFDMLLSQTGNTLSEDNKSLQLTSQDSLEKLKRILLWLRDIMPITEEQLNDLHVEMADFLTALKFVQPSAKREGFATIPDVSWDDIGALHDIRRELQLSILGPVKYPEKFEALGLGNPSGILLCGPPGCGKTLLAKAVANESGINFISVKGPELLNMYVGESERAVRQCFQRARNSTPCVIFFDELDSLCPRRSHNSESGSSARVVNQLLTEMDGVESRKNVFIIGATNRPDIIDPAILRPGRLDKILYVGLPKSEDRVLILTTITKNGTRPKIAHDVNLKNIAFDSRCEGYSGADLAALVREASVCAFDDHMKNEENALEVSAKHFEIALQKVKPSVSPKDKKLYDKMCQSQLVLENFNVSTNDESGIPKILPTTLF